MKLSIYLLRPDIYSTLAIDSKLVGEDIKILGDTADIVAPFCILVFLFS